MELKWHVYFKVPGNLRLRFRWIHRQGKGQGDEQLQQSVSCYLLQSRMAFLRGFCRTTPGVTCLESLCLTRFRARREILEHLRYTFVEVLFIFSASSGRGLWTTPPQVSFVFSSKKLIFLCKSALL